MGVLVFSQSWFWRLLSWCRFRSLWSLSQSWVRSCPYCLVLCLETKAVQTSDDWRDASLKTHCHYQLVDVQWFCSINNLPSHFGYIRRLVLAADEKRIHCICDIVYTVSAKMNSITDTVYDWRDENSCATVSSWDGLKKLFSPSWFWRLLSGSRSRHMPSWSYPASHCMY